MFWLFGYTGYASDDTYIRSSIIIVYLDMLTDLRTRTHSGTDCEISREQYFFHIYRCIRVMWALYHYI